MHISTRGCSHYDPRSVLEPPSCCNEFSTKNSPDHQLLLALTVDYISVGEALRGPLRVGFLSVVLIPMGVSLKICWDLIFHFLKAELDRLGCPGVWRVCVYVLCQCMLYVCVYVYTQNTVLHTITHTMEPSPSIYVHICVYIYIYAYVYMYTYR